MVEDPITTRNLLLIIGGYIAYVVLAMMTATDRYAGLYTKRPKVKR